MRHNWLFFTNLDLDGGRPDIFPAGPHVAEGFGGQLFSHIRSLVDSSLYHTNKFCNSRSSAFQDAFSHMSNFAGALFLWPNSILFRRLSGNSHSTEPIIGQTSTQMKHITSCAHHLEKLILDSALNNEAAVPLLFAKFAGSTIRRIWKGVEHQAFPVLSLAVALIPPNLSSKVLSDSIPLGNADEQINVSMHRLESENDYRGCSSVATPNTSWARDAIEPKTGIKFPAILDIPLGGEVSSNRTSEVLVGTGYRSMRIIKVKTLKLYAFGLYVHPDSICEKLALKYASLPSSELQKCTGLFEDLLREDIHMTVRLVINCNGLKISSVRNAFEKSLRNRLQKMNPNTDYDCLRAFGSHFTQDIPLPVGTAVDFRQTADGQLITEIEGKLVGAVQSKDLCRAFFDMYIGDTPVSVQAKQEIGQNVADLIKRC